MRLTISPSFRDMIVEIDRMCPVCHADGVVVVPSDVRDDCYPTEVVCELCGFRFSFYCRSVEFCHG